MRGLLQRNRIWRHLVAVGAHANRGKSAMSNSGSLKMVTCPGCDAKVFIPGDLPPLSSEPCKKCGTAIMMPMTLRQFELRSKIASGGMGTVYRAWDMTLERMVAVKLMKKELLAEPKMLESFYLEARAEE